MKGSRAFSCSEMSSFIRVRHMLTLYPSLFRYEWEPDAGGRRCEGLKRDSIIWHKNRRNAADRWRCKSHHGMMLARFESTAQASYETRLSRLGRFPHRERHKLALK